MSRRFKTVNRKPRQATPVKLLTVTRMMISANVPRCAANEEAYSALLPCAGTIFSGVLLVQECAEDKLHAIITLTDTGGESKREFKIALVPGEPHPMRMVHVNKGCIITVKFTYDVKHAFFSALFSDKVSVEDVSNG